MAAALDRCSRAVVWGANSHGQVPLNSCSFLVLFVCFESLFSRCSSAFPICLIASCHQAATCSVSMMNSTIFSYSPRHSLQVYRKMQRLQWLRAAAATPYSRIRNTASGCAAVSMTCLPTAPPPFLCRFGLFLLWLFPWKLPLSRVGSTIQCCF